MCGAEDSSLTYSLVPRPSRGNIGDSLFKDVTNEVFVLCLNLKLYVNIVGSMCLGGTTNNVLATSEIDGFMRSMNFTCTLECLNLSVREH